MHYTSALVVKNDKFMKLVIEILHPSLYKCHSYHTFSIDNHQLKEDDLHKTRNNTCKTTIIIYNCTTHI